MFRNMALMIFVLILTTVDTQAKFPPLRIASYNVRNFSPEKSGTHLKELYKILKSTRADIISVQEIVDDEGFKFFIESYLPHYKVALSKCGGFGNQKLGFIYNSKVYELKRFEEDSRLSIKQSDCDGGLRPAAIALFKKKRTRFTFAAVAVHLKAGGGQYNADTRYAQLKQLTKIIREIKNDNIRHYAVMGDFNTTDYLDRNHNYDRFVEFTIQNKLIDFSEDLECTTYWSGGRGDGLMHGSVLDHVLVSESLYDGFSHSSTELKAHCGKNLCESLPEDDLGPSFKKVSDHCPVVANMR